MLKRIAHTGFIMFLSIFTNAQSNEGSILKSGFITTNNIEINNISMWFNNRGTSFTYRAQSGGNWNIPNELYSRGIIFDQGPWLIGKRNGEIILTGSSWMSSYSPGPIINGQAAMIIAPEDSLKYRVYKLTVGDDETNPDYAELPIGFGAPSNSIGEPITYGDQMLWTVYNYLDSTLRYPFYPFANIIPVEIEIQQNIFGREGINSEPDDLLSNVIFMEWIIIYKGQDLIDSAYFGFWCDIDFEPLLDNYPAVDTTIQTGYCWTNVDTIYAGRTPLAVGYTLLYGPVVPSVGGNAFFKGKPLKDHNNLELNAFRGIGETALPPDDSLYRPITSIEEAWNFARGFKRDGNPYWDPVANKHTKFPFSGNPVTGEGWLSLGGSIGGESGFMLFTGPFNLLANDTQWVMIALVPGLGQSNLNSIEVMREKIIELRSLPYDSIANIKTEIRIPLPDKYTLYQNYPNPFNPTTTIRFELPQDGVVTIELYDILGQKVKTILNEFKRADRYEIQFSAKGGSASGGNSAGLASGVYIYRMRINDFITSKKMMLIR